jgi:hypothetical protein
VVLVRQLWTLKLHVIYRYKKVISKPQVSDART